MGQVNCAHRPLCNRTQIETILLNLRFIGYMQIHIHIQKQMSLLTSDSLWSSLITLYKPQSVKVLAVHTCNSLTEMNPGRIMKGNPKKRHIVKLSHSRLFRYGYIGKDVGIPTARCDSYANRPVSSCLAWARSWNPSAHQKHKKAAADLTALCVHNKHRRLNSRFICSPFTNNVISSPPKQSNHHFSSFNTYTQPYKHRPQSAVTQRKKIKDPDKFVFDHFSNSYLCSYVRGLLALFVICCLFSKVLMRFVCVCRCLEIICRIHIRGHVTTFMHICF